METDAFKPKAYFFLLLSSMLYGGNLVAAKVLSSGVPLAALASLRGLLGLLILIPFAYAQLQKGPKPGVRDLLFMALIGFLGISFAYMTFLWGLQYSSGTNASIIFATGPAVTNLILALGWRAKQTKRGTAGIAISFVGLLYVFIRGSWHNLLALQLSVGDLLLFANVVSIAFFNILGQMAMKRFPPMVLAVYSLFFGTLLLTPYGLYQGLSNSWHVTWSGWLLVLYMGAMVTGFAVLFNMEGVNLIGSGRAAIFSNLLPVFGILLSVIFLKESLTAYHYIGFALVLSGMVLSLLQRRQETGNS